MRVTLDFINKSIEIHEGTIKEFKILIETGIIDIDWKFKTIPVDPVEFLYDNLEGTYKSY